MDKITARILYNEIGEMAPQGGLYVWVDPDESSTLLIQSLIKGAPFKAENTTEYHATVLYHLGELPKGAVMPNDSPSRATITELIMWPDKHGTGTVVALLDSHDLQTIHRVLLRQGLTHTFPDFKPHVTVGTKVSSSPALRLWLEEVNQELAQGGLQIGFDARLQGSTLED
jgi:2'-5' RNA ligase